MLLRKDGNSELFVDHKTEDTHHGGTALVEFNGTLLQLGFFVKGVPSKVNGAVTEVPDEFGFARHVTHDGGFQDTNKEKELDKATGGDFLKGGEPVGDGGKGLAGKVNGSRKTDAGFLDEVSDNGKHGDTSVLQFNFTKTVELGLVSVGDKTKRIVESKRRLSTKGILEGGVEARGGSSLLGRSKGGGSGNKGGENNRLHLG